MPPAVQELHLSSAPGHAAARVGQDGPNGGAVLIALYLYRRAVGWLRSKIGPEEP